MFPKNERIFSSTLTIKRLETAKYIKCMKTFLSMGGMGDRERGDRERGRGDLYDFCFAYYRAEGGFLGSSLHIELYRCLSSHYDQTSWDYLTPGITELVTLFAISESLAEGGFEPLTIRSMEGIFQLSYPYTYGKSLGIILTSTKSSTSTDTITLF